MQKTYPKKVFSDSPKKTIFLHKPIALRLSFNRLSSKFEKHKKKVDRQKKPLIPSLSSIFSLKNKEQKSKEIKQRILKQKPNINSKMINFYKESMSID